GLIMVIVAFMSCAMPGAEEQRTARGLARLLSTIAYSLGDFAP
ncbi:MAG: hypothetical protein ACI87E_002759, partial [Mariniblastus sp.]